MCEKGLKNGEENQMSSKLYAVIRWTQKCYFLKYLKYIIIKGLSISTNCCSFLGGLQVLFEKRCEKRETASGE